MMRFGIVMCALVAMATTPGAAAARGNHYGMAPQFGTTPHRHGHAADPFAIPDDGLGGAGKGGRRASASSAPLDPGADTGAGSPARPRRHGSTAQANSQDLLGSGDAWGASTPRRANAGGGGNGGGQHHSASHRHRQTG